MVTTGARRADRGRREGKTGTTRNGGTTTSASRHRLSRGSGQQRANQQGYDQQRANQQGYDRQGYDQRGYNQQVSVPLLDGEEIVLDARPAWTAYFRLVILAAVVFLGGLVGIGGGEGIAVGFIGAGIIAGYIYYLRQKVRYVVTDRRMMVVRGLSSKATNEAWMVDIIGLQTGASLLERLLGHGHVKVMSQIGSNNLGFFAGLTFGGIKNHQEVAKIIRERQNEHKN